MKATAIDRTVTELPLTEEQKATALEYAANILYRALCESGVSHYETKSYDPLTIEGHIAHSYVFEFEDGGRHHPFRNYEHLEQMLIAEGARTIRDGIERALHPEVVEGSIEQKASEQ